MSVSSLPEWKQLLLERKRREEEKRERREKEEEEKLASMPAWKRGIIQRRKAKQDGSEQERDILLLQVDVRSTPTESDSDSSATVNLGSELSLSPDPGQCTDADPKSVSEVSVETIVPLHENPFIRTQYAWRKVRDADAEVRENKQDRRFPKYQDGESRRGRDGELEVKRFRDVSEGQEQERSKDWGHRGERDNSRERWENVKCQRKNLVKDAEKEVQFLKVKKDDEEGDLDSPSGSCSPLVPHLQTIRAENIIIIEQDRKRNEKGRGRRREEERKRLEEERVEKKGMKKNLRELLGGEGSVTEIQASEVLIIKPSGKRSTSGTDGEGRDVFFNTQSKMECNSRELRTDMSWIKGRDRSWGQATVIKEDNYSTEDDGLAEKGGRVSQLLSKFGEHRPPTRSKSSENFLRHVSRKYSGDEEDQECETRCTEDRGVFLKGLPKRSFSFCDRVVCTREKTLDNKRTFERVLSGKTAPPWADRRKEMSAIVTLDSAKRLDKEKFGKCCDKWVKNIDNESLQSRRGAHAHTFVQDRFEVRRVECHDERATEMSGTCTEDKGFTVATVKNTEGVAFARRVVIRQGAKGRSERVTGEKCQERRLSKEKSGEKEEQAQVNVCYQNNFVSGDGFESSNPHNNLHSFVQAASTDTVSPLTAAEGQHRHKSAFTDLLSTATDKAPGPHLQPEWSGVSRGSSVLSQHTEELISKIEKIGETTVYGNTRGEKANKAAQEPDQEFPEEGGHDSDVGSPASPTKIRPLEIQIPRTVFYVADEMVERQKFVDGRAWEGQGVQRRDSWRIGKPLSRIESLREKIRQRELERLKQREMDGQAESSDTQTAGQGSDQRGAEIEEEREAAANMRKKLPEADTLQEDAAAQTSTAAFDVTQEVLKTCPQLPVSVAHSRAVRGEEVTSRYTTAAAEIISDNSEISDDDDELLKHDEEQLRVQYDSEEDEEEEEEEEEEDDEEEGEEQEEEDNEEEEDEEREEEEIEIQLSEEEDEEEYKAVFDPAEPPSPSPPYSDSLTAMSRIYNLETVGSRTGLCLRDRTVDISPVHLVKVTRHISKAQEGDADICNVQRIQTRIEQLRLKEQEALKSCSLPNHSLKDRETKWNQSAKGVLPHQVQDKAVTQSESNYKMSLHRVCSPTSHLKQTITVNPSFQRSQSPENSLKPTDCGPTPASSPNLHSPSQSRSASPSPTPSPVLFSIKSASGGQVKRGTTFTICPKRHGTAEEGAGGSAGAASTSAATPSTPTLTQSQQAQTTPAVVESVKKKYPTAEEIEVIGGYQNLEKSCLVKNKGTTKKAKVCFDEEQLEQVCEYPSETSMLAITMSSHDVGRQKTQQAEEAQQEKADKDGVRSTSKNTRSVGTTTAHGVKVGQCHPLLKKHKV